MKSTIAACLSAVFLLPSACLADVSCAPKDNTAKILASPSVDDIHPDWQGESYVGLSWTFVPDSDNLHKKFLHGDLYSPKGAVVTPDAYIMTSQWDCQ